VFSLRIQI